MPERFRGELLTMRRYTNPTSFPFLTLLPWPWLSTPNTTLFLRYPKVIPYTKFEHFGIFRFFELCFGQRNRQTNKQMEPNILIIITANVTTHPWLQSSGGSCNLQFAAALWSKATHQTGFHDAVSPSLTAVCTPHVVFPTQTSGRQSPLDMILAVTTSYPVPSRVHHVRRLTTDEVQVDTSHVLLLSAVAAPYTTNWSDWIQWWEASRHCLITGQHFYCLGLE